jgi:hypothetical protein
MEEIRVFDKLLQYENEIINASGDDENQHCTEDRMHEYFIENCHKLTKEEIIACQYVIKRVGLLGFARWCA